MYILLADETNRDPDTSDFFVYGALYFEHDKLPLIHRRVEEIRRKYGYRPEDELKWTTGGRPDHIDPSSHRNAKSEVVDLAEEINAEFIPVVVAHAVTGDEDPNRTFRYCIRDALSQFNWFLENVADDFGICAVDPLPSSTSDRDILESVFHTGLNFGSGKTRRLDRIKMIATVSANASHAASLMDIVLGAFKFCINNPSYDVCEKMFYQVAGMTKGFTEKNGFYYLYGVMLRPRGIRRNPGPYQSLYKQLVVDMNDLLARSKSRTQSGDESAQSESSSVDEFFSPDPDLPF